VTSIVEINPLEIPNWDKAIASFQGASFFHTQAWIKSLQESYHYEPRFCCLRNTEGYAAILPLMEVNSWITGKRAIALPFTDECPPLYTNRDEIVELFDYQKTVGKKRSWKYIEIRGGSEMLTKIAFSKYMTHSLWLEETEETLFNKLSPSTRRAVRKGQNSAVFISEEASMESVRAFYELQCITRKRHGLPPQPFRFFETLFRNILETGKGLLLTARYQDKVIAGAVFLNYNGKSVFKYGASDKRYQSLRANNLIMWEAITRLSQKGLEELSFGRSDLQDDGLRRFKMGWGARESEMAYIRYDLSTQSFLKQGVQKPDRFESLFRRLPLNLNKLVGTVLYRHAA